MNGEMVGFTLVGLGNFDDKKTAFDAGTGIVKTHRGQGIVREMFDFAVPPLRKEGVESFILEVLKDNPPAIKAYQQAGFTVRFLRLTAYTTCGSCLTRSRFRLS